MLAKTLRLVSTLCLSCVLALSCLAPTDARAAADPVDLFVEALLDADTDTLDRLLASNYVFIGSNGHVQDKEHFID